MKKLVIVIFLIINNCFLLTICAQNNKVIDSLKQVITTAEAICKNKPCHADTVRINAYIHLADELILQNPDSAYLVLRNAKEIAENLIESKPSAKVSDEALKYLSVLLSNLGYIIASRGDYISALEYFEKTIEIQKKSNDKTGLAQTYNNIGYIYQNKGSISKAIEYYNKSIEIRKETNDKAGMAQTFVNLGYLFQSQGDIVEALECFDKSLKLQEEINDKYGIAYSYINLGFIYQNQEDLPKALEYYNKSAEMLEEIGDKRGLAYSYNNIGALYSGHKKYAEALDFFNKSLKLREEISDRQGVAGALKNIGVIHYHLGDASKAIDFYNKSLLIQEEIGDKLGIVNTLNSLGKVCLEQKNISISNNYAIKGYNLSKELGFTSAIQDAASLMKEIMIAQGNFKKAFVYYTEEIAMRDSVQNEENYKQTQKQQARYEYQKQATADSISHIKELEIKDLDLAKQRAESQKQRIVIYSFLAGLIIIIVFALFLYRLFIQKKKANIQLALKNIEVEQKNEEITAQRDEISAQRDLVTKQKEQIEHIHEELTDSINYAKRIQDAVLPISEEYRSIMGEHFILFRPKDIVSGDFYWTAKIESTLIVAVADCTGHGVPGAFMSMMGISFLNEIIRNKAITKASEVLNVLRKEIINALQQKGQAGEQKDGMDISLVAINTNSNNAQWAGANNPLWVVKSHKFQTQNSKLQDETTSLNLGHEDLVTELVEVKPDKMPIAIYERMDSFTNHELQLNSGEILYLMSDGYEDQFGGPKGKKFLSKNLKQLLIANSQLPMNEQKELLESKLLEWIGEGEQIDDITILGIKI